MNKKLSDQWKDFPDAGSSILVVEGVQVASIQGSDDPENPWEIYNYDSDFQTMLDPLNGIKFNNIEDAKKAAMKVFLNWILKLHSYSI